jgi:hypothetical protein
MNPEGIDIFGALVALDDKPEQRSQGFLAHLQWMERQRIGPWSGQPGTGSTGCSPAQYGSSNANGSPMFSWMPPSGDRLSERMSRPSSHTAKHSQSTTECMPCMRIRRPRPTPADVLAALTVDRGQGASHRRHLRRPGPWRR